MIIVLLVDRWLQENYGEKESDLDAISSAQHGLAFGAYKIYTNIRRVIPEEVSCGSVLEDMMKVPPDARATTLKFDSYANGDLGAQTILKMITGELQYPGRNRLWDMNLLKAEVSNHKFTSPCL